LHIVDAPPSPPEYRDNQGRHIGDPQADRQSGRSSHCQADRLHDRPGACTHFKRTESSARRSREHRGWSGWPSPCPSMRLPGGTVLKTTGAPIAGVRRVGLTVSIPSTHRLSDRPAHALRDCPGTLGKTTWGVSGDPCGPAIDLHAETTGRRIATEDDPEARRRYPHGACLPSVLPVLGNRVTPALNVALEIPMWNVAP
jgi:hypothetical protein